METFAYILVLIGGAILIGLILSAFIPWPWSLFACIGGGFVWGLFVSAIFSEL